MPHLSPLSWGFMGILGAGSCMMMHYFNWWRRMLTFFDKGQVGSSLVENAWGWYPGWLKLKAKDCKSFYDKYPLEMCRTSPHLVEQSPWPLFMGMVGLSMVVNLVMMFRGQGSVWLGLLSFLGFVLVSAQWWRDVIREGTYLGFHSGLVVRGLKIGMVLFILSEVMFFFGFFWAFFHSSLAPSVELGCFWPPVGVEVIPAMGAPLLNTGILLGSGVSVTYAHHSYLEGDEESGTIGLICTIGLGVVFTGIQALEYSEAVFSIADSVYGSAFFLMTGFHGLHVLIGSIYLGVSLFRGWLGHYSPTHHVGFEFASWYWHFVDVVWIFLFVWVYWWGA